MRYVICLVAVFSVAGCKTSEPASGQVPSSQPAASAASTHQPVAKAAATSQPASQPSAAATLSENCDRKRLASLTFEAGKKVLDGVKLENSIAQSEILAAPDKYQGKRVRIEGPITAICQGQGCWMGLRGPLGKVINLKVDDGVVDFRKIAQVGLYAIGEGVFSQVGHHGSQVKISGALIGTEGCK